MSNPTHPPPSTGIDWLAQYDDVVRLVGACPQFQRAVAAGLSPDDLLQDVLGGLIARERGTSGWDPARGSLGSYVWLVTRSVVALSVRRWCRRRAGEVLFDSAEHAATLTTARQASIGELVDELVQRVARLRRRQLRAHERRAVEMAVEGYTRAEIVSATGLSVRAWEKLRQILGRAARDLVLGSVVQGGRFS